MGPREAQEGTGAQLGPGLRGGGTAVHLPWGLSWEDRASPGLSGRCGLCIVWAPGGHWATRLPSVVRALSHGS